MGNPNPKVTVVGGGTGISVLLQHLRDARPPPSAIVTMFDSGGSSGLLRGEFGLPPLGDLRKCTLALAANTPNAQALAEALEFRFSLDSSLNGHVVGNLLLAALAKLQPKGVEEALTSLHSILNVRGRVLPVTFDRSHLKTVLTNGEHLPNESALDRRGKSIPKVKRIYLDKKVAANQTALKAITESDVVILGPGDIYSSVLPNLLVTELRDTLVNSPTSLIFVCNLMTKRGETDFYTASEFARVVTASIAPRKLDAMIVNDSKIPADIIAQYKLEGSDPVQVDLAQCRHYVDQIIVGDFVDTTEALPLRHSAHAVMEGRGAGARII